MADVATGWPLVGRDKEMTLLAARARAGPVVVVGPSGVGKSRLVSDWLGTVDGPTAAVVATRSSASVPFAAFAPWSPATVNPAHDRLGTLRAVADRLLEHGPITVLVDDAHLLDDGSAALVHHLVHHTDARLVATVRSGEPCPDSVTALGRDGTGARIDLRPLTEDQCARLLTHRLGGRVHSVARRRLWELSAGNPLYLREVTEAALELGHLSETAGVWRLADGAVGTARLSDLVSERMGRVPDDDRRVLELIALGEPLPLALVEELVPVDVIARLETAGLVGVARRGEADVVGLGHPLYSEVLRATTPRLVARAHQRDLATAALAHGLEQREPLRVAVWLQEAGGEPGDAELLTAASTRAMHLQDHPLAARLAQAAQDAGGGTLAILAHARAIGLQGRLAELDAAVELAASRAETPQESAEVVDLRAVRLWWRSRAGPPWIDAIDTALATLPPEVTARVASTGARLAVQGLLLDRARTLAGLAVVADDAEPLHDSSGRTAEALARALQGEGQPVVDAFDALAGPALELLDVDPMPGVLLSTAYQLASTLTGRLDEAGALLAGLVEHGVPDDRVHRAQPLQLLARTDLERGRVGDAAARAREAVELIGDQSYLFGRAVAAGGTAVAAAAQAGDVGAAESSLAVARARGDSWIPDAAALLDLGEAWLAAGRGELTTGSDRALDVADRMAGAGAHGLEVLALLDATRIGAARRTADRLAELGRRLGEPTPAAAAILARGLARDDGDALDEAATRFVGTGALLAAAEASAQAAVAHAGEGMRRKEAAARRRAQELRTRCQGAVTPLLVGLDDTDVAEELTAREREIALIAAGGRTNREIAAALGLSLRTVNSHLNHAYAKLGTSDRAELARLLRPPTPTRATDGR
ncbi:hypothetical protein HC251_07700 [Iamia sp. SCSIO 61187]|uniref:helix-turn-helix transcriptional regulator n=1 Tax=Iamia sp. SCSIO 61187 TaxID=2722752 RepID=UPI0021063575|nr:LuxR C-terminal-related transcriptional regulator [Iamia sp. SCSIO 61187]QYG92335.1 hypothetical protein HC251_07700 [Iamia sp. SCSIO 61187]